MLNNPHVQNALLIIGAIVAYNIEGHNDPAWLAVTILLIFRCWFKDIKLIMAMMAMDKAVEEIIKFQDKVKKIIAKSEEKNTKK